MKIFLNRRAFTLAELMAVVAIIAILAGIALGSYSRSVERAHFTEALSLAHQIAAARDTVFLDQLYGGNGQVMPTKFSSLPLELDNASGSVYTAKHYQISIDNSGYVQVNDMDGHYSLCVYQQANTRGKLPDDKCLARNDVGKRICTTMGFQSSSGSC